MAVAPEMAAVMPEPEPEQPTIVVLGGGFAGQSTLKGLKTQPRPRERGATHRWVGISMVSPTMASTAIRGATSSLT